MVTPRPGNGYLGTQVPWVMTLQGSTYATWVPILRKIFDTDSSKKHSDSGIGIEHHWLCPSSKVQISNE